MTGTAPLNILVIGGTGAFGARLCDLLARDGHSVTIASRHKQVCTKSTGQGKNFVQNRQNSSDLSDFAHREFDRNGPLTGFDAHDVIVDAAGPFHAYGDDPYRIARAAIEAGAHYFDLCDNADFCQGISVLDASAKAAGVTVLSGMSSVPAVSSAVVEALRDGQTPEMIETAILPGNKAPRGRAVVESILDQLGQNYVEKQVGRDIEVRSWSDPRTYDLGRYKRQAWRIEVPDQRLFPEYFDCKTVEFRAGLELGVMRYGLGILSWVRDKLRFGMPRWAVSLAIVGAKALAPFGTDRGGMIVRVTTGQGVEIQQKTWVMTATKGDGPYTPAVVIRAACRDLSALSRGASPALCAVPLAAIEACFDDLNITTNIETAQPIPAFRSVLGPDFDTLPAIVRETHDSVTPRVFKGLSSVTRGKGAVAGLAALVFGFPQTADSVEVEVRKTPTTTGEIWQRSFAGKTFHSKLTPKGSLMTEQFGPTSFDLALEIQDVRLHFPIKAGRAFGVPIPSFLLPISEASEADIDGTFQFDVHLKSPFGGTLVHYKGWLKPI